MKGDEAGGSRPRIVLRGDGGDPPLSIPSLQSADGRWTTQSDSLDTISRPDFVPFAIWRWTTSSSLDRRSGPHSLEQIGHRLGRTRADILCLFRRSNWTGP